MTGPTTWPAQDWIIVIEALAHWAGPPDEVGPRGERAYELIEDIAEEQGLPASELVKQADLRKREGPH